MGNSLLSLDGLLLKPGLNLLNFALLVFQDEAGGFPQRLVAAKLELGAGQGDGVLVVWDEQGRVVAADAAGTRIFGRLLKVAVRWRLIPFRLGHIAVSSRVQASGGGFEQLFQLVAEK